MNKLVGIIGGRPSNTSAAACAMAEAVGEELGRRGFGIVCGGDGGAPEAACRGCKRGGGTTIGILKWNHAEGLNHEIDFAIPTSIDLARNHVILWSGVGVIAFEGGYGTTSEIAVSLDIGKPLVVVGDRTLLCDAAFDTPTCRRWPGNDPADAPAVVDALLELIAASDLSGDARNMGQQ